MSKEGSKEIQTIGSYHMQGVIGEGTFGLVRLGVHLLTHEKVKDGLMKVAIKILEKVRINTEEDLLRVKREIKILKRLRHPNIIQLYEVFRGDKIIEDNQNIYLIMEYASRGELFNYIVSHTR